MPVNRLMCSFQELKYELITVSVEESESVDQ